MSNTIKWQKTNGGLSMRDEGWSEIATERGVHRAPVIVGNSANAHHSAHNPESKNLTANRLVQVNGKDSPICPPLM